MINEYTVLPFSLDHYPSMKKLFLSAFKANIDFNNFTKKYETKKLGHDVIGFLAIHTPTQEPAAFYGVFPLTVLINGKNVLAAQSGDTMTHRNHRRKRLFVHLAKFTFEECRKQGINLVFGQPNDSSKHGLINSLRFVHLDDITRYDLKLSIKTFPFSKFLKKAGLADFYNRYARSILRKRTIKHVKDFTNPSNEVPVKTLRDEHYLEYKSSDDKIFIRINNVILWIKFAEVLWIGDADHYQEIDITVIRKLKRLAFVLGYNTISFHFNKSLEQPAFLNFFKPFKSEASCFYYLNDSYRNYNMLITGADFDTW